MEIEVPDGWTNTRYRSFGVNEEGSKNRSVGKTVVKKVVYNVVCVYVCICDRIV